jgi:nitrite reductase (NADH) large subunit
MLAMVRHVIIGNSAAGLSALRTLHRMAPASSVTVISAEEGPAYSRVALTYYISGEIKREDLLLVEPDFYARMGVETAFGSPVVEVSPTAKRVRLENGREIAYDNLLVATGASAVFPDTPGIDGPGVFGLRSLSDADAILRGAHQATQAVVMGGGLIGLQTACALHELGLRVTVVVSSPHVLSQTLIPSVARQLEERLQRAGIEVQTRSNAVAIQHRDGDGRMEGVTLDDSHTLPCQMVIIGKGVRPNADFLAGTDVKVERGIVVDAHLQTSVPGIYAAGDVAQAYDPIQERNVVNAIWPNAVDQGRVAALNMAGRRTLYGGVTAMNIYKFMGWPIITLGLRRAPPEDERFVQWERSWPERSAYRRLVLKNGRLVGAVLAGEVDEAAALCGLLRRGTKLPDHDEEALARRLTAADLCYTC